MHFKVKEIIFTSASSKNNLKFVYDPMDMRVMKIQYTNDNSKNSIRTYYSYDAQGNVMATYERTISGNFAGSGNPGDYTDKLVLNEQMVYGASRLGMEQKYRTITTAEVNNTSSPVNFETGEGLSWSNIDHIAYDLTHRKLEDKLYELSEHRGNVMEVVTDRKLPVDDGVFDVNGNLTSTSQDGIVDYYAVNVVSYSDYAPYGAVLDGRNGGENYKFSFQGQESDPEIKGEDNSINYKYRMHDPRIGRFFAVDPLASKYPQWGPYNFSGNQVVHMVELEGLEPTYPPDKAGQTVQSRRNNGKTRTDEIFNYTAVPFLDNGLKWEQGERYTGPTASENAELSNHSYNLREDGYDVEGKKNIAQGTDYKLIKEYGEEKGFKAGLYKRSIEGVNFGNASICTFSFFKE